MTLARKTQKIKRVSMVDQVSTELKNAIIEGEWQEGEKLPSETVLADTYGVNRLTVRMALQKLNTIGIVETRVGEGSFVQSFSFGVFLNEISDIYLKEDKLKDILELRKLIELECIRVACIQASQEELDILKVKLEEYLAAKEKIKESDDHLDAMYNADIGFHYQICKMSHNQLYRDIYKMILPLIRKHVSKMVLERNEIWKSKNFDESEIDPHILLFQSIENRDYVSCQKIYIEMVDIKK